MKYCMGFQFREPGNTPTSLAFLELYIPFMLDTCNYSVALSNVLSVSQWNINHLQDRRTWETRVDSLTSPQLFLVFSFG